MLVISSSILSEKSNEAELHIAKRLHGNEAELYVAKFRGMKKMKSCRDEIKYFNILKPATTIKEMNEINQEENEDDFDLIAMMQ